MVGDTPREEGSPHEGMSDKAYNVTDSAAGGESTMTRLIFRPREQISTSTNINFNNYKR